MKTINNYIEKKDFEIIKTLKDDILFYTPNSQMFTLNNKSIREYFDICTGNKNQESSLLTTNEVIRIYNSLNNKFEETLQSLTIRKQPEDKLKKLVIPISGHCNLKCSYCFARVEDGNFAFEDLEPEKAKEIIDYVFLKLQLDKLDILFFGGEPFLNIETMSFITNYIKENYNEKIVRYEVTTNGTIYNKKVIDIVKQNNISVTISIDGPKENSNHRKFLNGESYFGKTINTIQQIKEDGINIGLRATIANDEIHLVNTYDFFEKMDIPFRIVFAHHSKNKEYDLANFSKNMVSLENQFQDLLRYYINHIDNKRKINCVSITEKLKFVLFRTKNYYRCPSGHSMFSIISDGDFYSCEKLAGIKKYSVGNMYNGIDEIKLANLKSINVEKIEDCEQCWLRYCCSGDCVADNVSKTGNAYKHDANKCELVKLEYKFIFALYYEINNRFPDFFKRTKNESEAEVKGC